MCLEHCRVWDGRRLRVVTTLLVTGEAGQQLDFQVRVGMALQQGW